MSTSVPMPSGYKEKVTDETLLSMVSTGVMQSVGDFLNSSDLARERQKSTYEYGMLPAGHLSPQGVSQIVSSDTVEAVEGYLSILSELMLNNNKIAKFIPIGPTPTDVHNAKVASDLVNYTIFKQNPGWNILNTWVKSSLLWKNSVIRWNYIEDSVYSFEEFDEIDQSTLDIMLSEEGTELVNTQLVADPRVTTLEDGSEEYVIFYTDVRLRRKVNKSRIEIKTIHPESFRITRDAHSINDAAFVGIQIEMTRSEIRQHYPEVADDINWDDIGDGSSSWAVKYTEEQAARKLLTGQEYWTTPNMRELATTEANRTIHVVECWLRVDRDGDGIAELKHFIVAGDTIILEEDCEFIPLAVLTPFEVPHEFFGLSVADLARPSTLASTAILRGFVENVYLTNYSPKLADPNVVDFSALQNMKPKQLIATNGNPNQAVAALTPDTISTGTVPLMEFLQMHKEQAHGLSKAAQGLNDTLYVSGNSEAKVQAVQSASQVRIQYIARRFAETGFKQLSEGIYKTIRKCMAGNIVKYYDSNDFLKSIDPASLPEDMLMYVDADVGEMSNTNMLKKLDIIGKQIIPELRAAGAGGVVAPEAAARLAAQTIEALDLDPLDYIVDYTTPEFKQQAEQAKQAETQAAEKLRQLEEQIKQLDIGQREATIALTNVQSKNAMQDNTRQLMIAIDKSYQEWAKLYISAAKEGIQPLPQKPDIQEIFQSAQAIIKMDEADSASAPKGAMQAPMPQGPAAAINEPQMQ